MKVIYTPKGRAREYSPLALNYYNGCDHGCQYCYGPGIKKKTLKEYSDRVYVRKNLLVDLYADLEAGVNEQVLLSFAGDPYCKYNDLVKVTTQVLALFLVFGVPVAILTKGGSRALQDLTIIKMYGANIKVGATAVFIDEQDCVTWEKGAAPTSDRLKMLERFHQEGVSTWLSLEPVIDPRQSIKLIEQTLPYVDEYKLGKLNHDKEREARIDWQQYLLDALKLIREAGKKVYVKKDLADRCPGVRLSDQERDMDYYALKGWLIDEPDDSETPGSGE